MCDNQLHNPGIECLFRLPKPNVVLQSVVILPLVVPSCQPQGAGYQGRRSRTPHRDHAPPS